MKRLEAECWQDGSTPETLLTVGKHLEAELHKAGFRAGDRVAIVDASQDLRAAMRVVLTHPTGYGVQICATWWLDRLEDGRFRVCTYTPDGKTMTHEELFDDVDLAITRYLEEGEKFK